MASSSFFSKHAKRNPADMLRTGLWAREKEKEGKVLYTVNEVGLKKGVSFPVVSRLNKTELFS